jgi:hypothetical protein
VPRSVHDARWYQPGRSRTGSPAGAQRCLRPTGQGAPPGIPYAPSAASIARPTVLWRGPATRPASWCRPAGRPRGRDPLHSGP